MNPTQCKELFRGVETVLVIDWPGREVPETLARAGFRVVVRGGPGASDYVAYEVNDGRVTSRPVGRPPESAELVYSYRPLSELPGILELARGLHARILWTQSGVSAAGVNDPKGCWLPDPERKTAHNLAQSSGLKVITEPYIVDVVRELKPSSQ